MHFKKNFGNSEAIVHLIICSLFFNWSFLVDANTQDAPKIQKFLFPEKLEVNEKVGTTCMLRSGKPPYTFRWLKDGKDLISHDGVIIQTGDMASILLIDPVTHSSAGNYTCVVKNAVGMDSYSSVLTVTAPPSWKDEPHDEEAIVGEKVSVKCSADGHPNPKIEWLKKGDATFFQRRGLSSLLNWTLFFNPVSIDDEGEYICRASNGIEDALEKKITIVIHGNLLLISSKECDCSF